LPAGAPSEPDPQRRAIEELLRTAKTIAVVGASDKPGKPSHRVAFYLMHAGFEVYPVNPTITELGGRPAFSDLRSVPVNIDIVDVFRRPEQVGPVVDEAIAVGAKAVWMQEGIVNEEAAAKARAAGLVVIMDRCVMKEHRKMPGRTESTGNDGS
jgi:predicted CoA-binding protein